MVSPVFLAASVDALTIMSLIPQRSGLQYMRQPQLDTLGHITIIFGNCAEALSNHKYTR